jgi:hypothetical protein
MGSGAGRVAACSNLGVWTVEYDDGDTHELSEEQVFKWRVEGLSTGTPDTARTEEGEEEERLGKHEAQAEAGRQSLGAARLIPWRHALSGLAYAAWYNYVSTWQRMSFGWPYSACST